jgi:anthranilate synthase component I
MVGAHPVMEIVAKERKVTIMDHDKGHVTEQVVDDPMQVPRTIMEGWHPQQIDQLPESFCGEWPKIDTGWVIIISYVAYVEM